MKVLLSLLFVKTGRVGGAESMAYNLVSGLLTQGCILTVVATRPGDLSAEFIAKVALNHNATIKYTLSDRSRFIQEIILGFRRETYDATIFPNYFCPLFARRDLGAIITIVHDLQYRHYKQNFPLIKRVWLSLSQKIALFKSSKVVAISDFVKCDLEVFYGKKYASKIVVVHNAIDWGRFGQKIVKLNNGRNYILSVAAQYPHKNLETLVRAFCRLKDDLPGYDLLLVGQLPGNLGNRVNNKYDVSGLIKELDLENRVQCLGFLDDEMLGCYYRGSSLFAFPSVFEGFGMPPVEAIGFGLDVITTACGAIPEVTLGLAKYVNDPYDHNELSDLIMDTLHTPNLKSDRLNAGSTVREYYSPENIGRKFMAAIRLVIEESQIK